MDRRHFLGVLAGTPAGLLLTGCDTEGSGQSVQRSLSQGQTMSAAQEWFQNNKFGMFIHWGVYSVLGNGEWVMHRTEMTVDEYEELPPQFNPTEFDPAEWVSIAKNAGMRYITITSKHHDGFAMWDSDVSDYNIVDATPYGKDVLKMLADECQKQDIKLFFYHSHLDWHHPDYYPRGRTGQHSGRPDSGNFDAYLDYMNQQITELCNGDYGQLGGFWFDGWWDQKTQTDDDPTNNCQINWRMQETYDLIHRLQPQAMIGNNHHVAPFPDENFQMFEKDLPGHNTTGFSGDAVIGQLPLETCDTINTSWGYNKSDDNYKSETELIHYLVRAAGYNSNFLLNVGPTPQGTIQPEFVQRLNAMGDWMDTYGKTIYGSRVGPMPAQDWGVSTQKDWTAYIHILNSDAPAELMLPGTSGIIIDGATYFDSNQSVEYSRDSESNLILQVPQNNRDAVDTIVELHLTS